MAGGRVYGLGFEGYSLMLSSKWGNGEEFGSHYII